jgi:hypothetical protein
MVMESPNSVQDHWKQSGGVSLAKSNSLPELHSLLELDLKITDSLRKKQRFFAKSCTEWLKLSRAEVTYPYAEQYG